ncbi:lipid-binding SYLF domain-containing protein [Campylobacter concisus]|uniref:lipid-binding SYLF domain-containing protein n=1 Tax=Campylobacter concisus TaxID=199 RepID=UPI00122CF369|nr:lipid-binding SYLF domain-containing protein [Campylobacter concisus]
MKRLLIIFLAGLFFTPNLNADVIQNQKLKNAINILNAFGARNLKPNIKFEGIKAIAIIPDVTKAGAIVTGSTGKGVFIAKNDDGEWSSPFFVNYTSGSVGLQIGYSSADMIILFKNSEAYANLFNSKDTISLKAEATGGVGNEVAITSDLPEISAFAEERGKTSGAFVGVSLDVARLKINIQDTNDYYERMYDFENIYNNSPKASKYTLKFKEIISKYFL